MSQNEIVSETNYYPFGLQQKGYNEHVNSTNLGEQFKFGGREFETELGLDNYAFGERNYNPALGRWFNVDPLAELMRSHSPFSFGFNNPVYFNDYGGTIPWPVPEMFKNWGRRIDDLFGYLESRKRDHNGIDINYTGGGNTDYGAPIVATHDGRVCEVSTTNDGAAGRYITLESPDGSFSTRYLHLSAVAVSPGDEVSEGQTIGLIGGSGYGHNNKISKNKGGGYISHLHYEIRQHGTPINPMGANSTPLDPQLWIQQPHTEEVAGFYDNVGTSFFENVRLFKISPAPMETRKKVSSVGKPTPKGIAPYEPPKPTPAPPPSPKPTPAPPPSPKPPPPVIFPNPCDKPDSGC